MRPGPALLRLLLWWTLASLFAAFSAPFLLVWGLLGVTIAALAARSYRRLARAPVPAVARTADRTLALGVFSEVRLRLSNPSPASCDVEIFDLTPASCESEGLPRRLSLPPRGFGEVTYRLRPTVRGDHEIGRTDLLLSSRDGFWRRRAAAGSPQPVRVVPNFRAVARYALLAMDDRLGSIGIRVSRQRGEGLEFEQLREYRDGDSLRRIDWKATAKRRTLVSREYREERNQQVICLVDCGRRMRAQDGDITHFDQVLNTVLLLTYVALRQGDAVGLMTFSGEPRWVPPVRGPAGLQTMVRLVYDLTTSTEPSDFLEGATRLMARQSRRALVVLVTNLRDEDSTELLPALRLLRTRNLVLLASLRETVLAESLAITPQDLRGALQVAAVHRYQAERERVLDDVRASGTLALDVPPEALPVKLVNRYLEVKRSGLL